MSYYEKAWLARKKLLELETLLELMRYKLDRNELIYFYKLWSQARDVIGEIEEIQFE